MDHNVRLCALENEEEIWFNRLSYYPGTKVMGGEMSFWICILFKIPTEGPKKVYHSKFVGFFFLIFTEGPKKFIIQNFLDFFLIFK